MGMGPSTNLYSIGGDPLTQIIFSNYIFLNFLVFIRNADSDKINGGAGVGTGTRGPGHGDTGTRGHGDTGRRGLGRGQKYCRTA